MKIDRRKEDECFYGMNKREAVTNERKNTLTCGGFKKKKRGKKEGLGFFSKGEERLVLGTEEIDS